VIALTAVATYAYFYGTRSTTAEITTATIGIGETQGFPLVFSGMLPGETQALDVNIQNGGTRPADLYLQMIGSIPGYNFCYDTTTTPSWTYRPLVWLRIQDRVSGVNLYDSWICPLYPGQSFSVIASIGSDIPASGWQYLSVYLTLAATTPNGAQTADKTETVRLIAVQYNGPAPVPETTGFPTMNPWPAGDPNYGP
jgi:hypothetical protein